MKVEIEEKKENSDEWEDKYGVLKDLTNVFSRVRREITRDFTLAKLDEKDREMVIGLVGMAFFTKRSIEDILLKKQWAWDAELKEWKLELLDVVTRKKIKEYAKATFDLLMSKPNMVSILKRNQKDNWLVDLIGKRVREEEKVDEVHQESLESKRTLGGRLMENAEKEPKVAG